MLPAKQKSYTLDPNCMVNNEYDACIFWKNPVAQRGQRFVAPINVGDDLTADQTFGVKLVNLANPNQLRSSSITVVATDGTPAKPVNGKWKVPYEKDQVASQVAQLMAYYWLTRQELEMEARTGVFYAKGKGIVVDSIDGSIKNNAYWDGTSIVLGAALVNRSLHEMALSAEIYVHEMAHANLQFATNTNLFLDSNGDGQSCRTEQGCITAINEGQADFHAIMLFPDRVGIGETWLNAVDGIPQRNVQKLSAMSLTEFYNLSGIKGEVHDLGAAYASILYAIYTSPQMLQSDFEKLFSLHLQKMTSRTRFPEARDILLSDDLAFFNGKYASTIRNAFASRGVQ